MRTFRRLSLYEAEELALITDFRVLLKNRFKDLEIYFATVDPENETYVTNDADGKHFHDLPDDHFISSIRLLTYGTKNISSSSNVLIIVALMCSPIFLVWHGFTMGGSVIVRIAFILIGLILLRLFKPISNLTGKDYKIF